MNARSFLIFFFCCFIAWALPSCESLKELEEGASAPVKKVYAPGELKADEIETIALSEVGKREGTEINYRSDGVQDRNDLYYVSVVARPYRPDGRRTVVVDERGEVVEYLKGNRLPKYSGTASAAKKTSSPVAPRVIPTPLAKPKEKEPESSPAVPSPVPSLSGE